MAVSVSNFPTIEIDDHSSPPIPGHTPIQIDNDDEIPAHLLLLGDRAGENDRKRLQSV